MSSSINTNKYNISDEMFEQDHLNYISYMNAVIRNATKQYYEINSDLVNHYTFSSEYEIENEDVKFVNENLENPIEEFEIGENAEEENNEEENNEEENNQEENNEEENNEEENNEEENSNDTDCANEFNNDTTILMNLLN